MAKPLYTHRLQSHEHYLSVAIQSFILKSVHFRTNHTNRTNRTTNRQVISASNKMAEIISFALKHPKHINDKFSGYQIPNNKFQNLKKNQNFWIFNHFFTRSPDSTYHANNSVKGFNGYCHWYLPADADWIKGEYSTNLSKVLKTANRLFLNALKSQKYLGRVLDLSGVPEVQEVQEVDLKKYFKISKKLFVSELNKFTDHYNYTNDSFAVVVNNIVYHDENNFYINNVLKHIKVYEELFNTSEGRVYTVLGSLKKTLRSLIMKEYVEIDINASVQSISRNLFNTNVYSGETQNNYTFKEHNKMLNNKEHYRKTMHMPYDDAKTAILTMDMAPRINVMRGKQMNSNAFFRAKAKTDAYREESKEIQEVIMDKFYYNVRNPELMIGDLKVEDIKPLIDEAIRVSNLHHKYGGARVHKEPRKVFRLYELIEEQVRKEMINFAEQNNSEIYQIHDAIIVNNDVDTKAMQEHIKKKLSFDLTFSKEVY